MFCKFIFQKTLIANNNKLNINYFNCYFTTTKVKDKKGTYILFVPDLVTN